MCIFKQNCLFQKIFLYTYLFIKKKECLKYIEIFVKNENIIV